MIEINWGTEVNAVEEVNTMNELKEMKVADLKNIAKEMNIRGWRTMKKDELVEAIENNRTNDAEEVIVDDAQIVPDESVDEGNVNTQAEDEIVPEVNPAPRKNAKRMLEYNGKTQSLTAWAKELGIRHQTLYNRIVMKGMDVAEAFEKTTKNNPMKEMTNNG